ncbi:short chain dehydrogenase [Streptococcus gallolyticus]|uniref:Short chain dehydrogenase n=1 Tax=Streptococcus gallolyticus TaxID=315405 RepID=A0AA94M1J3_9STRE|nr:SDR family NAD(P)-dependent oxidoreductase [Streptococcus gallolyticus]AQP41299.1 D-alanyl-lipoteichoic acid biosynthesis protein [Streptococcus gallolyticus subsp. gallolyticus DSM 16831]SQG78579.1 short chain dehydrogenase [Streptococcus gallolyticus]
MNIKENTVLITGGASGIGYALAERFIKEGNEVIICGRSMDKLEAAKKKLPELHIKQCDISVEAQRIALFEEVTKEFPEINVIVNNAGLQVQRDLTQDVDWSSCAKEIATNMEAPIHLCTLFVPVLKGKENATIINVTSGLAFLPAPYVPIYTATKAGMHNFTFCLRQHVAECGIDVVEVIPPPVNTNLGGAGVHANIGADLNVYADSVMDGLKAGDKELTFGFSTQNHAKSRKELEAMAAATWANRGKMTPPSLKEQR